MLDSASLVAFCATTDGQKARAFYEGVLELQMCNRCHRARNPVAPVCPYCTCTRWEWRPMSGAGEIFSFVRFHRSYLPVDRFLHAGRPRRSRRSVL